MLAWLDGASGPFWYFAICRCP